MISNNLGKSGNLSTSEDWRYSGEDGDKILSTQYTSSTNQEIVYLQSFNETGIWQYGFSSL
jgi:hypothetical protein